MFEAIGEGLRIMHEGVKKEIDLDELERLAKAATPGPWMEGRHDMKSIVEGCPAKYIYSPLHAVAIACGEDVDWNQVICNAEYIVAACNAVPELIAENRALRERVAEYSAELAVLLGVKHDLEQRVRELEEEGRTLGERLCETEHDLTEALDKKEELEGRIAGLAQENSGHKRVIHILENKVLELKGQPIPMEPRLPTCDALCRPRYILQSNCSNAAKEAGE